MPEENKKRGGEQHLEGLSFQNDFHYCSPKYIMCECMETLGMKEFSTSTQNNNDACYNTVCRAA